MILPHAKTHQVYYTLRLWGLEAEWKGRQRKEGEHSNKAKERRPNDKIYKVNNPSDDNWTHPVKYCSKNLLKYLAEWARKKKSSETKRHWKWDCREGPEPWSQLWAQWCLLSPEGCDLLIWWLHSAGALGTRLGQPLEASHERTPREAGPPRAAPHVMVTWKDLGKRQ